MASYVPLRPTGRLAAALGAAALVAAVFAGLIAALHARLVLTTPVAIPIRAVFVRERIWPIVDSMPPPPDARRLVNTAPPAARLPGLAGQPIAGPVPVIEAGPLPDLSAAGAGSGAGTSTGAGQGTGGAGGAGHGSGSPLAQLAGGITMRDYPPDPAGARVGKSVLVVFTVGPDGRAHDCRVAQPSGDAEADAITCRIAEARFRFRPATDAAGRPVAAPYGWRQSWHYGPRGPQPD